MQAVTQQIIITEIPPFLAYDDTISREGVYTYTESWFSPCIKIGVQGAGIKRILNSMGRGNGEELELSLFLFDICL